MLANKSAKFCVLQSPKIWRLKRQHFDAKIVNKSDSKRAESLVFL